MRPEARLVKTMLREYELCVNCSVRAGALGLPRLRSACRWGAGSSSAPAASWSWELKHENGSWILINIKLTLELEALT